MRTLAIIAATILAAATLPARAASFSSIVVYGDSLSDDGNLYKLTGGLAPAAPYVNGVFSNGPVAVQQLATLLNTPLLDFAVGGATTGVGNIGDGGTPTSFGAVHLPGMATEFAASAGQVPSVAVPSALFVVWGGADDFEALSNPTVAASQAAAEAAAADIDELVAALQAEGATHILVPNLPDLGDTPEFSGNAAAIAYSSTLDTALATTLPSGAMLFDTNAVFQAILAAQGTDGFPNVSTPCLSTGANPACTGDLFFDDIHPTTAADAVLAQDFEAALTPAVPEPSSLLLLGAGLAGLVAMIRSRRSGRRGLVPEVGTPGGSESTWALR